MRCHPERAKKVAGKSFAANRDRTHLYKYVHQLNGDAPQKRFIPPGVVPASLIHRWILFFTTIITYHSGSDQGFQQAVRLFESFPRIFSPAVTEMEVGEIQEALKVVGFIYPNEAGRRWKLSGQTLFEIFDGEPLKIFELGTIDDIIEFKKEHKALIGYGPKLLSLLALFYEELGLIEHVPGAFPVDVHIQAQCIATGIIEFNGDGNLIRTEGVAEELRKQLSQLCYAEKMPPLELSHAHWFLGNRMCQYCSKRNEEQRKALCPIERYCRGRISTKLYRTDGLWDAELLTHPLFEGRRLNESE